MDTELAVAWKVFEVPPAAIETLAGTVNAELLATMLTAVAVDEVLLIPTVQVAEPPLTRLVDEHVTLERVIGGLTVSAELVLLLPLEAVNMTVCDLDTLFAIAEKTADMAPGAIIAVDGTVSAELLALKFTAVVVDDAPLTFTVQLLDPPLVTLDGEQLTLLRVTGGFTVNDVFAVLLPKEAVNATVCAEETEFAVAENVAEVAPEAIEMLAGMVTVELLAVRLTVVAVEEVPLIPILHVAEPPLVRVAGVQLKLLKVTDVGGVTFTVTVALVPVTVIAVESGAAPSMLLS